MTKTGGTIILERWTPQGRRAVRKWYRQFRQVDGMGRSEARSTIGLMYHAAVMGDYWTGIGR